MSRSVLIIGGSRFVGPGLIKKLLLNKDQITVFNRGNFYNKKAPQGVRYIKGDRESEEDLKQLCDREYDVVYDMCGFTSDHAVRTLEVLGTKIKHLVFFSSAAVYEKTDIFPIKETAVRGAWDSFGDYGVNKAAAENRYVEWARVSEVKLTIFRPVYILGCNNYFDRENYFFSRLQAKEPILVPGNGDALLQFAFLEDVVEAFFVCPLNQTNKIETLNVGGDEYVSILGFIKMCAELVEIQQRDLRIVNLKNGDFGLDEKRFYDDLYPFPNLTLILDNSKIKILSDIEFTSLKDGLTKIYSVWVKNWDNKVHKFAKEKEIIINLQ